MPWWAVISTTAIIFSEVYPVSTCANCSVYKLHTGGLSQIAIDTHRLVLFSKTGCQFKFLHSGHPNNFSPHLSIRCRRYGTRCNRPDKRFLEIPQFYPWLYTNKNNHFGHSFAFDAPTLWNDFPDDVHSASTLACFRKKIKIVSL